MILKFWDSGQEMEFQNEKKTRWKLKTFTEKVNHADVKKYVFFQNTT